MQVFTDAALLSAMRAFVEASRTSSDAVLEALCAFVSRTFPLDAALVFEPDGDELRCRFAAGLRTQYFEHLRVRRDALESLPASAAHAGHRMSAAGGLIPTDRRAIAVPLLDREDVRAVAYFSTTASLSAAHEDALVRAVEHAAGPFAAALERERDRNEATYDALTGLFTPRAFRARLAKEILDRRLGRPLSLWFVDTDRFKTVNDTFGHAAGDRVLQGMAALLQSVTVPGRDVIARNGGDEFCALIFESQKTVAIELAQELCNAVRAHDFGVSVTMSASIGVATFPYDARNSSELLETADAAMYHSKRSGRDRVSFSTSGAGFAVYDSGGLTQPGA